MDIEILDYNKDYLKKLYLISRNCYGLGDSENKGDYTALISKLIAKKHTSTLEHAYITIKISGCSRSFMSQITRHRHASFTVKSQHYVIHEDFKYKEWETPLLLAEYNRLMGSINDLYKKALNHKIPHFIAREILPNAALTNIYMTCNLREWKYILNLRARTNNTPEMINFSLLCIKLFYAIMPEIFEEEINEFIKLH